MKEGGGGRGGGKGGKGGGGGEGGKEYHSVTGEAQVNLIHVTKPKSSSDTNLTSLGREIVIRPQTTKHSLIVANWFVFNVLSAK